MTRGTQVLVVAFEIVATLLVFNELVPPALEESQAAGKELATRRQEEEVRKSLQSQEATIREVYGSIRELLRDSAAFGLHPDGRNRLTQELSTVVNLAGLRFQRFSEVQPAAGVGGGGDEDSGDCLYCSLDVLGDYPTILRFLLLQKERLPCLRLVELKAQRALTPGMPLSVNIAFAAPILGGARTEPAEGEDE